MIKGYTLAFKTVTAFIIIVLYIYESLIPILYLYIVFQNQNLEIEKKTLNLGLHFPYIYIMYDEAISLVVATYLATNVDKNQTKTFIYIFVLLK